MSTEKKTDTKGKKKRKTSCQKKKRLDRWAQLIIFDLIIIT